MFPVMSLNVSTKKKGMQQNIKHTRRLASDDILKAARRLLCLFAVQGDSQGHIITC